MLSQSVRRGFFVSARSLERSKGTVKWFNDKKGFGFISPETGEDVFVHQSNVQADGFRALRENMSVSFEVIMENGKRCAKDVTNPDGSKIQIRKE
jgi:cold shock CspA family protein